MYLMLVLWHCSYTLHHNVGLECSILIVFTGFFCFILQSTNMKSPTHRHTITGSCLKLPGSKIKYHYTKPIYSIPKTFSFSLSLTIFESNKLNWSIFRLVMVQNILYEMQGNGRSRLLSRSLHCSFRSWLASLFSLQLHNIIL